MNLPMITDLPPLVSLANLDPVLIIPLVAIPLPFLFVICIVGMKLLKDYRTRKLQQETIRLIVDKGQPIPPELMRAAEPEKDRHDDRRTGLILLAVGLGLSLFFRLGCDLDEDMGSASWIGLIPALIGLALLANRALENKDNRKDGDK